MPTKKLYIVRSFIEAPSLKQALKASANHPPDEIYIADDVQRKAFFSSESSSSDTTTGFKMK